MNISEPALVAIVGPTAVGKTEVSIEVARSLLAEIVSADSRLLYKGMDIGTAKPIPEELELVPHHLIDVAEPGENWSLAQFKQAAEQAIAGIQDRNLLPMLVGGTGQYVTAILEGWLPPPKAPDDAIRRKYERLAEASGPAELHAKLADVDPASAKRIDPANVRRVVRALEIYEITGIPASEQRQASPPAYRTLKLGLKLPRAELYERIDQRIDRMIESGLVGEVQALLDRGISIDHPPMSGIGYRQIGEFLLNRCTLEESVREMRKLTRQFVRRQANWFKPDDPEIDWYQVGEGLAERLTGRIRDWLRAS